MQAGYLISARNESDLEAHAPCIESASSQVSPQGSLVVHKLRHDSDKTTACSHRQCQSVLSS